MYGMIYFGSRSFQYYHHFH